MCRLCHSLNPMHVYCSRQSRVFWHLTPLLFSTTFPIEELPPGILLIDSRTTNIKCFNGPPLFLLVSSWGLVDFLMSVRGKFGHGRTLLIMVRLVAGHTRDSCIVVMPIVGLWQLRGDAAIRSLYLLVGYPSLNFEITVLLAQWQTCILFLTAWAFVKYMEDQICDILQTADITPMVANQDLKKGMCVLAKYDDNFLYATKILKISGENIIKI